MTYTTDTGINGKRLRYFIDSILLVKVFKYESKVVVLFCSPEISIVNSR